MAGKVRDKGTGSVYWSEGRQRWEAMLDLGIVAGKRKRRKFTGPVGDDSVKARRAVLKRLEDARRDYLDGSLTEPTRQTVAGYLRGWLERVKTSIGVRTHAEYESKMRLYVLEDRVGVMKLTQLTGPDLEDLYARMEARGLSRRTALHTHRILHRAFEQAVARRWLKRNPAQDAATPKPVKFQATALSREDAVRLMAAARGDRMEALWWLLLGLGLRIGEGLGLRWRDVDLDKGVLRVTQAMRVRGPAGFGEPKSAGSRRALAMGDILIARLRQHQAAQDAEQAAAGASVLAADRLVFCQPNGSPMTYDAAWWRFGQLVRRAGLPPMRQHDLRHTNASLLMSDGVSMKLVSGLLGHSGVAITGDLYGHVQPGDGALAAGRIDRMFEEMATQMSPQPET